MKKTYIKPQVLAVDIELHRILCGSQYDNNWVPREYGGIFG